MTEISAADALLIDNAAACCQSRLLADSASMRECIVLNVIEPTRKQTFEECIAALQATFCDEESVNTPNFFREIWVDRLREIQKGGA